MWSPVFGLVDLGVGVVRDPVQVSSTVDLGVGVVRDHVQVSSTATTTAVPRRISFPWLLVHLALPGGGFIIDVEERKALCGRRSSYRWI